MSEHFPRTEAFKFGWKIAKENIRFFIPIMLAIAVLNYASSYIDGTLSEDAALIRVIVGLSGWVIGALVSLGLITVSLKFTDHRKPEYQDFMTTSNKVVNFIAASILYGIIVGLGLVLLIVPGIILAIKLQFFGYFIADKNAGPVEALKQSWTITAGVKWQLFLFVLVSMVVNIVGTLLFLVGLLWTFPMTQVASAYIYRKLAGHR